MHLNLLEIAQKILSTSDEKVFVRKNSITSGSY